jgi:transcriptional regulator with XRE-family HTH domain
VPTPMRAFLAPTELAERLRSIGMNQTRFAKRAGVSRQRVNRYCHGAAMPASVERALQLEELIFQLRSLIKVTYERIPKGRLRALVAAAEPHKLAPQPKPRRKHRGTRVKNWLSPKHLPRPDPASIQDDPLPKAEWQKLADDIGRERTDALREKLLAERPAGPRRRPSDGDELMSRVTEPI